MSGMWQIKRALTLVLAIVAGIVGGTATGNILLYGSPISPLSVETLQALKARQLTRNKPVLPDGRTYLEAAHSSGKTLVLNITVFGSRKSSGGRDFLGPMKRSVIDVLCGNDSERDVLNRGGDRRYVYHDVRGAYIGEFKVTVRDCQTVT